MPGTIGLTNELLEGVLERIAEQTITNGFKNVVVMGDHGGGQAGPTNVYAKVAKKLDDKYGAQGVHVFYCDQVYMPANGTQLKVAFRAIAQDINSLRISK